VNEKGKTPRAKPALVELRNAVTTIPLLYAVPMNITTLPSLLGIFALGFLALLLVKVARQPAADRIAKRLLILLLIGMLAMAACVFYIYADMDQYWPRLSGIDIGLSWWIGPSLYFYIKRVNGGANPFAHKLNLLHWLPAIVIEMLLLPYFLRPIPGTTDLLGNALVISQRASWFIWWGFHLQLSVYLLLSQRHLQVYRQRLRENYSDISLVNLRWLQFCCGGFIAMILAERLLPAVGVTSTSLSQTAGSVLYLFIIALMYQALGQSRLTFASVSPEPRTAAAGKYQRSGLRDDSAQYYLDKLAQLMTSERHYLQSDLSLQALAEQLKLSPHHLSQILNDKLGKNFYDYINEQRVEYAKQLLLQDARKSITDIAFEAGYNSKNSFYNAFRRHCGMTPADYRNRPQHQPTLATVPNSSSSLSGNS
jgi:AraC-like DNA-binding protein